MFVSECDHCKYFPANLGLDINATGNPTVGYGHLCTQSNCAEVPYDIPLSDADADQLLRDDIEV